MAQTYENPVYNQRFQFNVDSPQEVVVLEVIDGAIGGGRTISRRLPMSEFRELMDNNRNEIKEFWFDFDGIPSRVRLMVDYLYNKMVMYDQQVTEWNEQLKEDVNDYENIKDYLE